MFKMKISIITPTLNEALRIANHVDYLIKHGGDSIAEIIIADAESPDNTAKIAQSHGAKVISVLKCCRANQMNRAAEIATGDILFFVHADTVPPPTFVEDIKKSLEEGYETGCFRVKFDMDNRGLNFNAYMSRFKPICFRGGDQTLYVTRTAFDKIGGFDEKIIMMEDYDIILRLKNYVKLKIMETEVLVSARKVRENGKYFQTNFTNLVVFCMFFLGFSQETMIKTYHRFVPNSKYKLN
jgi:rSAM/selenodomain-associated transferase 2